MTNLLIKIKQPLQKAYHYLFEYDFDRMSIPGQFSNKILADLSYALLHRAFVMITYNDASTDIGQITKRISAGRFIFRLSNSNLIKIIDLDDVFRVDLA